MQRTGEPDLGRALQKLDPASPPAGTDAARGFSADGALDAGDRGIDHQVDLLRVTQYGGMK